MIVVLKHNAPEEQVREFCAELEAMGHATEDKGSWNLFFGGVQGIEICKDGTLRAGADPRRDGKGLAY